MAEQHRGQLMVCHERIDPHDASAAHPASSSTFCALGAYAWCVDCGYYVCDIHVAARHERHRTQLVTDEQAAATQPGPPAERRSGAERRR